MKLYYFFFHESDLDKILENYRGRIKPKFLRHRYSDIIASGESMMVGKYKETVFVVYLTHFPPSDIPELLALGKFEIELVSGDKIIPDLKKFRFGEYYLDEGKLWIKAKFDERLFYDALPAELAELLRAEVLLRDSLLWAEKLSTEETKIIDEIVELSERAKSCNMDTLENLVFEISDLRTDFFRKFMRFKDMIEESFSSISSARYISEILGGLLLEKIVELEKKIELLHYYESKFQQTLSGVGDSLQVASLRLDMLRNRETLELQKRTSALQAAAAIIEFVAVYYYTLKIWESFLPVKEIPSYVSFSILALFTGLVVFYTDALGEYIREKKPSKKLVILTISLIGMLILMATLPTFYPQ
jgi:hypothetical protein